jgi:hypothetical protein
LEHPCAFAAGKDNSSKDDSDVGNEVESSEEAFGTGTSCILGKELASTKELVVAGIGLVRTKGAGADVMASEIY